MYNTNEAIENLADIELFAEEDCVTEKTILTEDVWFAWVPDAICLDEDTKDVDLEWDYSRKNDELRFEVKFSLKSIFGEDADTDAEFKDVDLSALEAIFDSLGATHTTFKDFKIKDDKVEIKMIGHGIDITDEEVFALPKMVEMGLTYDDGAGNMINTDLALCVEKFDPHSPIAFDLNGDGKIGTTGVSTAKDRVDDVVGETVMFDIDADGKQDEIEWMSGDGDALLFNNSDGMAHMSMDGSRLFGDEGGKYENGYEKLALLDVNGDGALTGAELDGLEFWIDDGDAILEDGENHTLASFGIESIAVGFSLEENGRGELLMQSTAVATSECECTCEPTPPVVEEVFSLG